MTQRPWPGPCLSAPLRRRVRAVLASLVVLGVAACSSHDPAPVHRAHRLWSTPVSPLMQPLVVDGVPVLLGAPAGRLSVEAFDTSAGRELWRDRATPSAVLPGIATNIALVHDAAKRQLLAYYSPEPYPTQEGAPDVSLLAHLKVVKPLTGEVVADFAPTYFRTAVAECDDGHDVCAKAQDTVQATATFRRYDVRRHTVTLDAPKRSIPKGGRELGSDVYDLGSRSPETLTRLSKTGQKLWSVPVPSAFPPGSTSDHGWLTERDSKSGVDLVELGGAFATNTLDLRSWGAMAAIDDKTGTVLWQKASSSLACSDRLIEVDGDRVFPVRCHYEGRASFGDVDKLEVAKDVRIEGFDLRSGRTTWSIDAGPYRGLFPSDKAGPVLRLGEYELLLDTTPQGRRALDLRTGKTRKVSAHVVANCRQDATYTFEQAYYIDGKPYYDHSAGELASFCTAADKPTATVPDWPVVAAAGTAVKGVVLVASKDALTAYRQESRRR